MIVFPSAALAWAAVGTWSAGFVLLLLGLVVGLVPSVLVAGWLSRRDVTGSFVPIAVALSGALAGVALLHTLNGALETSPGRVTRGAVTFVNGRATWGPVKVRVRWVDGSTEWLRAWRSVREGARVERTTHPGALGFEWTEESW